MFNQEVEKNIEVKKCVVLQVYGKLFQYGWQRMNSLETKVDHILKAFHVAKKMRNVWSVLFDMNDLYEEAVVTQVMELPKNELEQPGAKQTKCRWGGAELPCWPLDSVKVIN